MDCEFRSIIGWLQSQIPSLELEIINSIRVHLWLDLIKGILAGVDSNRFQQRIPRESLLVYPTFSWLYLWLSLWVCMCESSRLGDALRLGDGCGALSLGAVGVKWGSWARKGEGEFGGDCLQGVVDRAAVLRDERGGGVYRGFGLAPFQVEVCVPSFFTSAV